MKIAYIIFDGITWLDLIGVYDPVSRLKSMQYRQDLEWDICAFGNEAADNFGFKAVAQKVRPSLNDHDVIIVPGGHGTRTLVSDAAFMEWLKEAKNATHKISICTGSLLLGAAGFLRSKRATTNYQEYETLKQYCAEVLTDRIVEDGDIITAGAVACSLDLGLFLCDKWAGAAARDAIRKKMGYEH